MPQICPAVPLIRFSYAFSWSRPLAGNVGFRADVCRAGLVTYTLADLLT